MFYKKWWAAAVAVALVVVVTGANYGCAPTAGLLVETGDGAENCAVTYPDFAQTRGYRSNTAHAVNLTDGQINDLRLNKTKMIGQLQSVLHYVLVTATVRLYAL